MNNHFRTSFLYVLVCLFSGSAAFAQTAARTDRLVSPLIVTATAANDRMRIVSIGEIHVSRLQVFSTNGSQIFDSGLKLGNLVEWKLWDEQGSTVDNGSYLYLVTIRDFSESTTQKYGTAQIDSDQIYLERSSLDSLPVAQVTALETNKQAEVVSPIDRVGAAAMGRIITAATGNDLAGSGNTASTDATSSGAPNMRPEVTGTGTQNFLSKWTDSAGTLGDSPVFSTTDRIGIGTMSPGAKFHVVGTQGSIGAGSFQLDTGTTFSAFTAAYPAFEVVNTNQTNNNVSLFQFADAPSGASHAGIGAVSTNHQNKFGDLFFYTNQPADGYKIRMGIFGNNVGIGTISPGFKLHVVSGRNALRVETNLQGGAVASFGGNGDFLIDAPFFPGGRFWVAENGNVGIGVINDFQPLFKLHVVDSGNTGLRVDTSSLSGTVASFGKFGDFRIDAEGVPGGRLLVAQNGTVGIGTSLTTFPLYKLQVIDPNNTGLRVQTNTAGGTVASFGGLGQFQIDAPNSPAARFVVKENGNVGIGNPNPNEKLNVNGNVGLLLAGGGGTSVCQNGSFQLSMCGSSLRYKEHISAFGSGLNLVKQLSPITFNWKQGGMKDLGLSAEDVEKVDPLLVTYNDKGQVEGVKYDRMAVVLINAVKEQQKQIETLRNTNKVLNARLRNVEKRLRKVRRAR